MQIYLVGGAVRDTLLERPIKDRDYVVVGATAEHLTAQGFVPVGKDFPVFLHPHSQAEYALARVERKTGSGYGGFSFCTDTHVTLEEDLSRRDLTINAMAIEVDEHGNVLPNAAIIDPYHGQADLAQRVFRHVSPAFVEDPLRVLRVARFMARYHSYGFAIAPETLSLLQAIGHSGELTALSAPRVWQETARALLEASPMAYFDVLNQAQCLTPWFSDLCLASILPHAKTPLQLPSLPQLGEEEGGVELSSEAQLAVMTCAVTLATPLADVKRWCAALPLPNLVQDCILLTHTHHAALMRWHTLPSEDILRVLQQFDVLRRPERICLSISALQCAKPTPATKVTEPTAFDPSLIHACVTAIQQVNVQAIIAQGYQGAAIKPQLQLAQLAQINAALGR